MRRAVAAAMLVLLASCGRGGGSRDLSNVDVGTVATPADLQAPIVALGDTLVARSGARIATSTDGGHRWTHPDLPGAPSTMTFSYYAPNAVLGDLAVVTAHDDAQGSLVWTSDDGLQWRGGPLLPRTTEPARVGRSGDALVAAAVDLDGVLHVKVSHDRGRTWTDGKLPAGVPLRSQLVDVHAESTGAVITTFTVDEHNVPVGAQRLLSADGARWTLQRCAVKDCLARRMGDALLRGDRVSLDDGGTWESFDLDVKPKRGADPPSLTGAVDAGGTWIGAASSYVPSDVSFGYLGARDRADHWRSLVDGNPCDDIQMTRPNEAFTLPVALGDIWISAATCVNLNTAAHAELLGGSPTDRRWSSVPMSFAKGVRYDQPVQLGDAVIVPVTDDDQRVVRLLRLTRRD